MTQALGTCDVAVIGGGVVGSALALGLAERGQRVVVCDEGDRALRAARVNFGLVWLQSKGDGLPAYMRWTRRSVDLWPAFAEKLRSLGGVDVEYRKVGGLVYTLGDTGFEEQRRKVAALEAQADVFDTEMVDRAALERLEPDIRFGRDVSGASYCPHDGHANPLMVLRAMHAALAALGAKHRPDAPVKSMESVNGTFRIHTAAGVLEAGKVLVAAGHGIPGLAAQLGLPAPLRAERGQVLVTERLRRFIRLAASGIRQTEDGTVMIGSSQEKVGLDDRTTVGVGGRMAARAIRIVPELAQARLQRTWGGIRVLTPDKHPVYAESPSHPGAFVFICHSGVTLAAVHAGDLAAGIAEGRLPDATHDFHPRRFDVPKAA